MGWGPLFGFDGGARTCRTTHLRGQRVAHISKGTEQQNGTRRTIAAVVDEE